MSGGRRGASEKAEASGHRGRGQAEGSTVREAASGAAKERDGPKPASLPAGGGGQGRGGGSRGGGGGYSQEPDLDAAAAAGTRRVGRRPGAFGDDEGSGLGRQGGGRGPGR